MFIFSLHPQNNISSSRKGRCCTDLINEEACETDMKIVKWVWTSEEKNLLILQRGIWGFPSAVTLRGACVPTHDLEDGRTTGRKAWGCQQLSQTGRHLKDRSSTAVSHSRKHWASALHVAQAPAPSMLAKLLIPLGICSRTRRSFYSSPHSFNSLKLHPFWKPWYIRAF